MDPKDRKETIELYAGLALPGVIGSTNILYSTPMDIAERTYAIAVALVDLIEKKELEPNSDYPC